MQRLSLSDHEPSLFASIFASIFAGIFATTIRAPGILAVSQVSAVDEGRQACLRVVAVVRCRNNDKDDTSSEDAPFDTLKDRGMGG